MAIWPPCPCMAKQTIQLAVSGMTCNNCVAHVTKALQDVPGVKKAQVVLDEQAAMVIAKPDVSADALVAAVVKAGYGASVQPATNT